MSAPQPIVSISIPTYNRAYLLEKSLAALCRQIDEGNFHEQVEIVISDNCSTDQTKQLVEDIIRKNKYRIVYNCNAQNLGVIKNILKLAEFSTGKYWMFYGDDDIVPPGALKQLIEGFESHKGFSSFMYKWPAEMDEYCTALKSDTVLSYQALARDYFYYIGNAGIFAVETSKVKEVATRYEKELIDTCWPQTIMIFVATFLSATKEIKFIDLVSSLPPSDVVVVSNGYYLFETTIYALLRTALSIEKITGEAFTDTALHSIYGIQHFESIKDQILERYYFYDLPRQKADLEKSVRAAARSIPAKYNREIMYLYKQISQPKIFLYLKFYRAYIRRTNFRNIKTGFLNKLKIASPLGFNAIMAGQVKALNERKQDKKRTEVDSSSGYF